MVAYLTRESIFCRAVDYSDSPAAMYVSYQTFYVFQIRIFLQCACNSFNELHTFYVNQRILNQFNCSSHQYLLAVKRNQQAEDYNHNSVRTYRPRPCQFLSLILNILTRFFFLPLVPNASPTSLLL